MEVQIRPFLISALYVGEWSVSRPATIFPAKAPPVSTEQEDGCDPKNMDILESRKYLARAGNWTKNPRLPGPQPSHYTDYTALIGRWW